MKGPPPTSDTEAQRVFDLQHAASRHQAAPDLATRLDRLGRLAHLITGHEAALARAISADFGVRSRTETQLLEIVPTLSAIRYARRRLAGWMKPERRRVDIMFQPAKAWVRREPLGVVGIISPWNYPLLLALSPLVDALAAGNRAMLKPSELTPNFSNLLSSLIAGTFAETEVAVVVGGIDTAQAFSSLPFDHLVFTGSTAVGRKVMQAAAVNLTPVTLELGGKSPAVICPDYPLEKAARSIAFGKFVNAGQTCIAPDYVLVPKASAHAFAQAVMTQARRDYPRIADNADYTSMITQRHYDRLAQAIEAARASGATVLTHEDAGVAAARKIGPTVVLDLPATSILLTEEIFGPVLPIVAYDSLKDALDFINARDRPLALYAFTHNEQQHRRLLDGATSGGVTLNGTLLHIAQESLPFGGVGPSGIGAYHGYEGFCRFSHARGVHQIGAFNAFERIGPPWGLLASVLARLLSRR
ncbi:coniferyl aldehyde dehydrogenase [Caulobacter sp. S45]|uniref:coniferyl aldehyde dehydrogenase n=1 Tax=Caulobacter sp. S45 TaxID=1641861 RepID=UPI00131C6D26|nr:coniferyl aldehyde dehydrogenase [Caulobacter sp. S45]